MKENSNNQTNNQSFLRRISIRHLPRGVVIGVLAGVVVVVSGIGWYAFSAAADDLASEMTVVKESASQPATVEPVPEATVLPRQLDGVMVPRAAANLMTIAVMLDDNPAARPHAGLAQASVVYNCLVEGGATRMMALYSSDARPGRIGPVRSAREYYLEWLSEYNGLYVHAGGSPEALNNVIGFGLRDLNCIGSGGRYCYRDNAGYAPHNLFTDDEKLTFALRDNNLADVKPTYVSWRFKDDDALEARGQFSELELRYSSGTYNVRYVYNRGTNRYARFHSTDPHRDRTTGEQIMAVNVLVQVIPPIQAVGEKGRLTLNVTGEGKAFLFRDGLVVPGKWVKQNRTERTVFIAEDGTEMKLNRGQTWVEVITDGREFPFK